MSDTSPLLHLARTGDLDLLRALYQRLVVPRTVWLELVEGRQDEADVVVLRAATWIEVVPDAVVPGDADPRLDAIDAGEAAAIALALRSRAALLLIDDAAGRRAAIELGIAVRGTLGALVDAKRRGFLDAVRPVIERLVHDGFRATPDVVSHVLAAVGEIERSST